MASILGRRQAVTVFWEERGVGTSSGDAEDDDKRHMWCGGASSVAEMLFGHPEEGGERGGGLN
jgi:hypothetical protein